MAKKFEIDSDLTTEELDTLIEALDDWEKSESHTIEFIEVLKKIPDPDTEDNPHMEQFIDFKRHMVSKESDLKKDKRIRREKAIFLKAKLLLLTQSKVVDRFCEETQSDPPSDEIEK